jgi:hypothetical protein
MTKFYATVKDTRYNEFSAIITAKTEDDAIAKYSAIVAASKKHEKVRRDPKGYTVTARAA